MASTPPPFSGPVPPILVAEDNPVNQQVMALLAKRLGLVFDFVSDGRQAVEQLQSHFYPLVLMDIYMPVMDGIQALALIRARLPNQPRVFALTGETENDTHYYQNLGFDGFLSKPLKPDALLAILSPTQPPTASNPRPVLPTADASLDPIFVALNDLSADIGDGAADILVGLINAFLKHTPELLADMHRAIAQDDIVLLHRCAHTLKSSAANVGAQNFSKTSQQLELILKPLTGLPANASRWQTLKTEIQPQITNLQSLFEHDRAILEQYLIKLTQGD